MGWSFVQGLEKSDLISNLTKTKESDTYRWETVVYSVRGNVLWAVMGITTKADQTSKRFIACYLLRKSKGEGWGYKEMDEAMYPYYYTCPLKYLKMVPETCAPWRAGVLDYHRSNNRKYKTGQKIGLVNTSVPWVDIVSISPFIGVYNGIRYLVPKRLRGDVIG